MLATEDPYAAASVFSAAGWKVEYESARAGRQPRVCVSLAASRVILVGPEGFHGQGLGQPRGVGADLQLYVPPSDLSGLFLLHRAAGLAISEPRLHAGERGFEAEIVGYRFLIQAGDADPDLALLATDPRVVALADGLRQRDGVESLTDSALRLAEGAGESVRSLRTVLRAGRISGGGAVGRRLRDDVGSDLAEVVVAAAVLARQLGVDLERMIDDHLS